MDAKWKWALATQKQIRETTLAHVMPDLGKTHMSIALKDSVKKIMPRDRAYKVLKTKVPEVEEANIKFQKEVLRVLTPTIEVREIQDAIKIEDGDKQEVPKLAT